MGADAVRDGDPSQDQSGGEALLAPEEADRDGYVPNVLNSCGGLVHDGEMWLPYGASDSLVGFATVRVAALVAAMVESPPGGSRDG